MSNARQNRRRKARVRARMGHRWALRRVRLYIRDGLRRVFAKHDLLDKPLACVDMDKPLACVDMDDVKAAVLEVVGGYVHAGYLVHSDQIKVLI